MWYKTTKKITIKSKLSHRYRDLVHIRKLDRITVDLELAEGRRSGHGRVTGVGLEVIGEVHLVVALHVEGLRHHVFAAFFIYQL